MQLLEKETGKGGGSEYKVVLSSCLLLPVDEAWSCRNFWENLWRESRNFCLKDKITCEFPDPWSKLNPQGFIILLFGFHICLSLWHLGDHGAECKRPREQLWSKPTYNWPLQLKRAQREAKRSWGDAQGVSDTGVQSTFSVTDFWFYFYVPCNFIITPTIYLLFARCHFRHFSRMFPFSCLSFMLIFFYSHFTYEEICWKNVSNLPTFIRHIHVCNFFNHFIDSEILLSLS